MQTFFLIIEFFISFALIIAILLHSAKGEGMGAIGGHARMFNSHRDLEAGLNKVTAGLAIAFFIVAGILGVLY